MQLLPNTTITRRPDEVIFWSPLSPDTIQVVRVFTSTPHYRFMAYVQRNELSGPVQIPLAVFTDEIDGYIQLAKEAQ